MAGEWEKYLERWMVAGVVDAATASRIRTFEQSHGSSERLRWPVMLALALGGLLLCAGVLLFVAAHWEQLSPGQRFSLVLFLVALFPAGGALTAERFPALSVTLHAVGTITVGAGIFLAAQIFNLEENWANGVLLWAIGAFIGAQLLRQWPQWTLVAILTPMWLAGEWEVRAPLPYGNDYTVVLLGLLLLAITYVSARSGEEDAAWRRGLVWVGSLALLPCAVLAFVARIEEWSRYGAVKVSPGLQTASWAIAIAGPLVLAVVMRGRAAWWNALFAVWVLVIATFHPRYAEGRNSAAAFAWNNLGTFFWAALGALGLVAWGVMERRRERINLGVAGFALTVVIFYFSNVMDKLGRSASLIGMGVIFLVGGWSLEKLRRKLIGQIREQGA